MVPVACIAAVSAAAAAADVEARSAEAEQLNERGAYITPRALMSILRLSQVGHHSTCSSQI
jgi:hypothetical protein